MSKPRYLWWSYAKGMARAYPELQKRYAELHRPTVTANIFGMPKGGGVGRSVEALALRELPATEQREYEAVRRAVETTERCRNGEDRLTVIRLVLWERSYTLEGAALQVPCSVMTARRYHTAFIMAVAKNYGLLDKDELQEPSQGDIMDTVRIATKQN